MGRRTFGRAATREEGKRLAMSDEGARGDRRGKRMEGGSAGRMRPRERGDVLRRTLTPTLSRRIGRGG